MPRYLPALRQILPRPLPKQTIIRRADIRAATAGKRRDTIRNPAGIRTATEPPRRAKAPGSVNTNPIPRAPRRLGGQHHPLRIRAARKR